MSAPSSDSNLSRPASGSQALTPAPALGYTLSHSPEIEALRRRNATVPPVARLIDDLLLILMLNVQASCTDSEELQQYLAVLTHVCHRWRELFINSPSLWSKIVYTHSDPLLAVLAIRSKESLLSIDARGPVVIGNGYFMKPSPTLLYGFCEKIKAYLPRARELRLELNLNRFTSLDKLIPVKGLKNLGLFELIYDERDGALPRGQTWNFVSLIAQRFPILKTLTLCKYPISIAHLTLPSSLTSLDLVQSDHSRLACTVPDVVLVLRQVPRLESLRLVRVVHDFSTGDPLQHDTVALPQLHRVILAGFARTNVQLLLALELPSLASLDLDLFLPPRSSSKDCTVIFNALSALLQTMQPFRSARTIGIRMYEHRMLFGNMACLRFTSSTNMLPQEDHDLQVDITLNGPRRSFSGPFQQFLAARLPHLADCKALEVAGSDLDGLIPALALAGTSLPYVSVISLEAFSMEPFAFLFLVHEKAQRQTPGHLPFPSLRYILFSEHTDLSISEVLNDLFYLVQSRANLGGQRLTLILPCDSDVRLTLQQDVVDILDDGPSGASDVWRRIYSQDITP